MPDKAVATEDEDDSERKPPRCLEVPAVALPGLPFQSMSKAMGLGFRV